MINPIEDQIEKEKAYNNYLKYFIAEKGHTIYPENLYENLYKILNDDLGHTKQVLGDFYFERFILLLRGSLDKIEEVIKGYAELIWDVNSIDYGYVFHFKPMLEKKLSELIGKPQPIEVVKSIKIKKEFKDFFNSDVKIETIENIQKVFKDYEAKKLAILIYLLQSEFKLSTYSLDSKTDGRKHFAESLINKTISMQSINNCFVSHAYVLDIRNFEKDNDYISTKEKLTKAIV